MPAEPETEIVAQHGGDKGHDDDAEEGEGRMGTAGQQAGGENGGLAGHRHADVLGENGQEQDRIAVGAEPANQGLEVFAHRFFSLRPTRITAARKILSASAPAAALAGAAGCGAPLACHSPPLDPLLLQYEEGNHSGRPRKKGTVVSEKIHKTEEE